MAKETYGYGKRDLPSAMSTRKRVCLCDVSARAPKEFKNDKRRKRYTREVLESMCEYVCVFICVCTR